VGVGVLIAVASDFKSELICCLSNIEFVAIKLTVCQTSVYITCSYIPPQSDLSVYLEHFSNIGLISSKLSDTDYLCVLGDFNLPYISWSTVQGSFSSQGRRLSQARAKYRKIFNIWDVWSEL